MKTNNRIPADIESFEDSIDKISPNYLKNGQYNISKEKYPFDSSEDKKDYVVRFHINDNELIEEKNAWGDSDRFMINQMREFYAMMIEKGLKDFVITIDRVKKEILITLPPKKGISFSQYYSSNIKYVDEKDFVIDINAIIDKMVDYYQRIFCDKKLLPTNDVDNNRATGFTERNLTFNFCHNYLDLNGEGLVWQEMPIIGQSRQHIDSVIVHSDTLILLEAKRLHSPYHFEELTSKPSHRTTRQHRTNPYGDLHRLQTYYKDIPIFDKQKYKACYAILLADFLIQRSNNKQTEKIKDYHSFYKEYFDNQEYKVFENDKMEYYLYYKVVPIINK